MLASSLEGEMMRTMLQSALAVTLMITASGLSGAARLAERSGVVCAAALAWWVSCRVRKPESPLPCGYKRFMGCVLVVRGNDVRPNNCYGFANLEWDSVVYCCD